MSAEDPWIAAMLRGDFETAWQISDRVLNERLRAGVECSRWPRHEQFIWRGQSWDHRRVLVRCYHGLGDTIQFVRFLPQLRAHAREVTLWVQPQLIPLFSGLAGADHLLPLHDGTPEVEYDIDFESMELGHALRITERSVRTDVPYIYVSPTLSEPPAPHTAAALHVGIAWRSGDWNPARSIPDPLVAGLGDVPGVRWFNLQYECVDAPLDAAPIACRDMLAQAQRMLNLDLIIAVDTVIAHLAGALGIPTWTLLRKYCDWRWMSDRSDTPWYPTMQLFRQPEEGDWASVIERVRDDLSARARSMPARGRANRVTRSHRVLLP